MPVVGMTEIKLVTGSELRDIPRGEVATRTITPASTSAQEGGHRLRIGFVRRMMSLTVEPRYVEPRRETPRQPSISSNHSMQQDSDFSPPELPRQYSAIQSGPPIRSSLAVAEYS